MNALPSMMFGLIQTEGPRFGGKHKERFSEESAALERRLIEAGVTKESLRDQWGVILWSLRQKGDRIKVKVEALREFDERGFTQWLQGLLGHQADISIKEKPVSKCCHSPCEGCLMGNKSKRKTWIG